MKKFSRSLIGYKPVAVSDRIDRMDQHYERSKDLLQVELLQVNGEIVRLQEETKRAEEELQRYEQFNAEITGLIGKAHFKATEKVYQAVKQAEGIEKDTEKNAEFKKVLDELTQEILDTIQKCSKDVEELKDD